MPSSTFYNLPEDKRRRIVEAALTEFADHPYRLASINRIVQAAEISKGSFYQYFDGKFDLFHWLLVEEIAALKLPYIQLEPGSDAGLYERLARVIRGGLQFGVDHPRVWRVAVRMTEMADEPDFRELGMEIRQMGHTWLLQLLADAQERGDVGPDVDLDASAMLLARVLNAGSVDLMLHRLGVDLPTYMSSPELTARVDLDALVEDTIAFVRFGLQGSR